MLTIRSFLTLLLIGVSTTVTLAQKKSKTDILLGLVGGMSVTSNPPALQEITGKSHYIDGNGGCTLLSHKQVTDGYAFEWQYSLIWSSVKPLGKTEGQTKLKFIMPLDFRFFLGNYQKLQTYFGFGFQYNTVWKITKGEDYDNTYYDPWWGVYYTETTQGESKMRWTVNQFSTNLAIGLKVPFRTGGNDMKLHAVMLGLKGHFPIVNNSDYHGDEKKSVDLSKDKVNVAVTGGLSFGFGAGNAFKLEGEYPIGGTNKYTLNDGGHSTFLNTHSWALSATFLFNLH